MKTHAPLKLADVNQKLFWAKVDKRGVDECWHWLGAVGHRGYGRFGVNGKNRRAHRVAWLLAHQGSPGDMHVCHTCDNPLCVNPAHLFLGDDLANSNDKCRKNRQHRHDDRGENGHCHKLTDDDVRRIRGMLASGMGQRAIASNFGMAQTTISAINRGKIWGHLQ